MGLALASKPGAMAEIEANTLAVTSSGADVQYKMQTICQREAERVQYAPGEFDREGNVAPKHTVESTVNIWQRHRP